jgi:hypothetical protein
MKYVELGILKWFGDEVTNHFLGRTVLDSQLTVLGSICYKEESDIHVSTLFASRSTSVLLKQHHTHVILIED